jgi:hypothetical protein
VTEKLDRWLAKVEVGERIRRSPEDVVAVSLAGNITGGAAMKLREECARRGGVSPRQLANEIIGVVIRDNLFAAVLDD